MRTVKIPIPKFLVRASEAFGDWGNVPLYRWRGHEFRRLDLLLVLFGIFNFGVGYYYGGWLGGAQCTAVYIWVMLCALWFF
jgi:hypothetical protein